MELCDLIAENPTKFPEKISWLCGRCPPPDLLLAGSLRVSRPQLNAVLALARFLSRCSDPPDRRPQVLLLEFLRAIPVAFSVSFWPQSFGVDSITSFFVDLLGYVVKATELSQDFATEVAGFMGEVVIAAVTNVGDNMGISRAFLTALSQNFPPVSPSDAEKLVTYLLDGVSASLPVPASPRDQMRVSSGASSAQSSPLNVKHSNESATSPANDTSQLSNSSGSSISRFTDEATSGYTKILGLTNGAGNVGSSFSDGVGNGAGYRHQVGLFEEETVESLEKQQIAFMLIAHVLERVQIDPKLVEEVRLIAKRQLQSIPIFLKVIVPRLGC